MATKYEQIWNSLQDEEYRREFADDVATGLAFQIRMLREKNGWTQEELAQRIGKRQETISLWENPNYESYTLKTLKSLAGAFDLVPVFRLGAFGELVEWNVNLTPSRLAPPSFVEEGQVKKLIQTTSFGVPTRPTVTVSVASENTFIVSGLLGGLATVMTPHEAAATTPAVGPTKKEPNLALAA